MGKKRKRRRSSQSQHAWLAENWKYLSLALVCAVTVGLLVAAFNRPEPTPAAERPVATAPTESASPVSPLIVAFVGDSYTQGINRTTDPTARWSTLLATELGWQEVNLGVGGSGFLQGDVYANRVQATIDSGADIVIVSGGRNDVTHPTEQVQTATSAFFDAIRAGLPDAQIIALSPWWDDDAAPSELAAVATSIKASVEAVGGTYVDAGQPLSGHPEYLVEDGIHPNPTGYVAIVDALRVPLAAAVKP